MMYAIAYPFAAALDLLATLVAFLLVNWWAPIFADRHGNLPRWLKWAQTFDASLDWGWQGGTPGYDKDGSQYVNRMRWIYRNPAYGFAYWVLGVAFDPKNWRVVRYENTAARVLFVAVGPLGQFNVYYHGRFGMAKIGWKAWNYWGGERWKSEPWGPEWRVPVVMSLSPFKRRKPAAE